jgi:molybdate transport system substrate-binding protein
MRQRSPMFAIVLLCALVAALGMVPPVYAEPSETLTIAAANSLKEFLRKVLPIFEAQHRNLNIRVVYGGSPALRDQIEQGAPVDLFLPSLLEEIEELERKGLVITGTKRVYAKTSLVLVTGTTVPAPVGSFSDLGKVPVRRIALGDPKTSAVGKVAAQFLKYSRLDDRLRSQYMYGEHSRAVLDLVKNGEAELGLVYRTDAMSTDKVRIIDEAPAGSHTPVQYGLAVVWTARSISWAREFVDFMLTPQVQGVLQEYGFDRTSSDLGLVKRQEVAR